MQLLIKYCRDMAKIKTPKPDRVPALRDLLSTLKDHPWVRVCKVCDKDCGKVAITKLVYTYEPCDCNAAPYVHLVENIYHATCFAKRANSK